MRARMHRRLFMWFGATIVLSSALAATIVWFIGSPQGRWQERVEGLERFAGDRFAEVWTSPPRRTALARAIAGDLAVPLVLRDAQGNAFERHGSACRSRPHRLAIRRDGRVLGFVDACGDAYAVDEHYMLLAMFVMVVVLWTGSRFIARWLTRPLVELIAVARELGRGNLAARLRLGRFGRGDLALLANAVNDMASRIEKQIHDQRELLAAVSHEIRTPLGHLRVLLEMAHERGQASRPVLTEIEDEILAIDALVGQLLASSRVDFGTLEMRPLVAADLAVTAVERAGLDPTILDVCDADTRFSGDAASILAALANLLRNAVEHGGGVETLRIDVDASCVQFCVEDRGPGFAAADLGRCFESFRRGQGRAGSLGLGLSLVRRIALAHGGEAWARNRSDGGAQVGFTVARPSVHRR